MKYSFVHGFTIAVISIAALLMMSELTFAGNTLRPLTTDRPDLTESPFTVNTGHVQVESTLIGYAKSNTDTDGIREEAFEFATTNIRFGLTSRSELNVVWQPFGTVTARNKASNQVRRNQGVGSLEVRAKINLFGNDTFDQVGDTALAVLPFISIPTKNDNGISASTVEGGVIVPFAVVLPQNFGLGLNAGMSAVHDEDDNDYHAEVFLSAALAYEWTPRFGTYTEIATTLSVNNSDANTVLLGTGFTYAFDDNTQLDGGINFGLTDASDRYAPFIGLTRRF